MRRLGDQARARSQIRWARARHIVMWIDVWCGLAGGLGRIMENGAAVTAVLCLRPPHFRQMPRYLGVIAGLFVPAAAAIVVPPLVAGTDTLVWWVWASVVGAALVVLGGGLIVFKVREARSNWSARSQRSELRALRPRGGWYVWDFAGDPEHKGHGRLLLEQVCDEADQHRRVLYLDTLGQRHPGRSLVPYYAEQGFVVVGDVDVELAGEQLVQFRMVREWTAAPGL